MKLFLFLDDWFLDSRIDIIRRYVPARLVDCIEGRKDSIRAPFWNAARKRFQTVVRQGRRTFPLESVDCRRWRKAPRESMKVVGRPPRGAAVKAGVIEVDRGLGLCSNILEDPHDCDPGRRFKTLLFPYTRTVDNCGGIEGGPGVVACSPDGLHWTMNTKHQWYTFPKGSDTLNNIFFNPIKGVWQVICRRYNNDRRVFMAQSADLEHWTEPRVIIHPDALDPPLFQFYGMAATCYEEEYFIGAIQTYYVPSEEQPDEHSQGPRNSWSKWAGTVDGQLAYSYDGETWCRSDRTVFLPRAEPDRPGAGCVYAVLIRPEKDRIVIHALGTQTNHAIAGPESFMTYELRPDGFSYLEPVGGWGRFSTRCLVPRAPEATLNYQAPVGKILVQVLDVERRPLAGYTFADAVPLTGDALRGAIRWKNHRDLSAFFGKRIRLEFRFTNARIYALRLDCGLYYTNTAEPIERA